MTGEEKSIIDITDETATRLNKFGIFFRISLIISLIGSGLTVGVDYIQTVDLVTTILFRLASVTLIVFRIIMWVHLFNAQKTEENKNLTLSFTFFTCIIAFSLISQILGIIGYFIDENILNYIVGVISIIALLSEIIFWTFFLRFLTSLEVNLFDYLLKNVRLLLVVLYCSIPINILSYIFLTFFLDFFFDFMFIPLVIGYFIVGIFGLILQFRVAKGILNNFGI